MPMSYTATGTAFDDIPVDGHRETWPISNRFRNWLRRLHRQKRELLDKTYYFLDETLRQLHCARRQALQITSDKKRALPVGAIDASSIRRCIAASILRARRHVLGLGKVSTFGSTTHGQSSRK